MKSKKTAREKIKEIDLLLQEVPLHCSYEDFAFGVGNILHPEDYQQDGDAEPQLVAPLEDAKEEGHTPELDAMMKLPIEERP